MFKENLQFYRLKKSMTKKELASLCSLSPMAITNYENGKRYPENMGIINSLARALDIRVSDFLTNWNNKLSFIHGEFRKNTSLNLNTQTYIRKLTEEYFTRFFSAVDILGRKVLPEPPQTHSLLLNNNNIEENAALLRKHLNLSPEGAIGNLVEMLENKGVLICPCDVDNDNFSGMNGFVDNYPYIVFNNNMSPERTRSNIAHELAHLFFQAPVGIDNKIYEKLATAIGGAFLCPAVDIRRELGLKRKNITKDMLLVCVEYGISMLMLVKRAEICNIISKDIAKNFFINAAKLDWRKNEPCRIAPETPTLFKQLVYRAVSEEKISIQKGAELLRVSYDDIKKNCYFDED